MGWGASVVRCPLGDEVQGRSHGDWFLALKALVELRRDTRRMGNHPGMNMGIVERLAFLRIDIEVDDVRCRERKGRLAQRPLPASATSAARRKKPCTILEKGMSRKSVITVAR